MSAPQIWQLTDTEFSEELELTGHEDQVYSLAWSQCGKYIATACKDGKIRSEIRISVFGKESFLWKVN